MNLPGEALSRPKALQVSQPEYLAESGSAPDAAMVQRQSGWTTDIEKLPLNPGPLWVRVRVHNPDDSPARQVLVLSHPQLDQVDFFAPDPRGDFAPPLRLGDARPFAERNVPYRRFVFPIDQAPGGEGVYTLRIETQGLMRADFAIVDEQTFVAQAGREDLLFGLFFGAMAIMALYNLVVFFSIRDVSYLLYSVWVLSIGSFLFTLEGFAFQYVYPDFPALNAVSTQVFLALSIFTGPLFVRAFLRTGSGVRFLDRLLLVLAGGGLIALVLAFLDPMLSLRVGALTAVAAALVVLVTGPLAFLRGTKPARFLVLANFVLLIAAVALGINYFTSLPETFFSRYGVYFGCALDAVLLSLGLADRIKLTNEKLRLTALSRDYMQDILYSLNECMLVIDVYERIRTCNPAVRKLVGYSVDELEGRPIGDLFVGTPPFRTGDNIDWKYDSIQHMRVTLKHRDGRGIPASFSSSVMRDAQGRVEGIVCLAQARESAQAPLTEPLPAERATELVNFGQTLRAPIHVILGMSRLLENANLSGEERRYLALLRQGGETLLSMGDRLVGGAENDTGTEPGSILFNLEDLLDSLGEGLALGAHERGLDLAFFIEPDVDLSLEGDFVRLRLILLQLLEESIRVTHQGTISLVVSRGSQGDTPTSVCPIRFSVRRVPGDTTLESAGSQFPAQKRIAPILATIGGRIEPVAREPRNEFSFSLGIVIAAPGGWAREKHPPRQETVLVADGSDSHRSAVREYLRGAGLNVTEARDPTLAVQALSQAAGDGRPFWAAVIDGGWLARAQEGAALRTALEAARIHAPGFRVCVMLLLNTAQEAGAAENEMLQFLMKPAKRRELLQRLNLHLPVGEPKSPATESPLRILLAEDNQDSQLLFQAYVRHTPHSVDIATNGEEAVQLFKTAHYDIVFMDMQMPVMDGFTAVFKIRKWEEEQGTGRNRQRTPIYALTAFSLRDDVDRSLRVGCTGHIAKPVSREIILDLLRDPGR